MSRFTTPHRQRASLPPHRRQWIHGRIQPANDNRPALERFGRTYGALIMRVLLIASTLLVLAGFMLVPAVRAVLS